jgi:hypothetical protein
LAQTYPAAIDQYVAGVFNNLGIVLRDLGEEEAAKAAFEESQATRQRLQ